MKICLVSQSALPALSPDHKAQRLGGAEVQLTLLGRALVGCGHAVSLVVAQGHWPAQGRELQGIRVLSSFDPAAGWPVLRFAHPRASGLWRALATADADTYLSSTAGMELGLMALFCRLHGRRLVFRVASDSDCDPHQLLVRYARDRWLYHRGLHAAQAVLVQSLAQQALLARHHGIQGQLVRGLVEAHPAAAPGNRPAPDIDALWVANLRALKRPEHFLALARANPALRFHMAGGPSPGEEGLFDAIRQQASGIANLTFHGPVPYLDIGALFDRARLLVNTSRTEGFPNTFLQAWARGIPVLTEFDPDGLVAAHGPGLFARDGASLQAGLMALQQPGPYARARHATLEHMQNHHNPERVLAPYLLALGAAAPGASAGGAPGPSASARAATAPRSAPGVHAAPAAPIASRQAASSPPSAIRRPTAPTASHHAPDPS
jgi:hypothetical protein